MSSAIDEIKARARKQEETTAELLVEVLFPLKEELEPLLQRLEAYAEGFPREPGALAAKNLALQARSTLMQAGEAELNDLISRETAAGPTDEQP